MQLSINKEKIFKFEKPYFSDFNIAAFTLIFMNIQILPIEGWPISMPKVIFMCITPFICLSRAPYFSKAVFWSFIFWTVTVALNLIQFADVRMSTFYYSLMYLSTFILYYNLVFYKYVFTLDDFIKIIEFMIWAYFICLIMQEISFIVGLRRNYLVNMMGFSYYELFRLNSLGIEPSSSARTLAVFFYALLKVTEYKNGSPLPIKEFFSQYKRTIFAFLYTMLAMGSGTAIVCLGILSLYFLKREYILFVILLVAILYFIAPYIDYTPVNRAVDVMNAAMTGDSAIVTKTDHSAASRVNIILDTFKYLDIFDIQVWFGKGVDASASEEHSVVSGIIDYGLISYILKLGLFFSCCFTSFFSIETVMYILIFGMNIGNIAYGWGALLVFATIKYFKYLKNENTIYNTKENYYI